MRKDWWKKHLSKDGRRLDLSDTELTSLEGVELPANLQELDLSFTNLTSLAGVELPADLQELDLSDTELTSLSGVKLPADLQRLDLSGTELTSLEGVELPANLQWLDLGGTELTSLSGVKLPADLQRLDLSGTELTSLPETLKGLKKLCSLGLSYMNLEALPDWLPELGLCFMWNSFGEGILLDGTTVEGVDMSIFDQPQEAILRWFEGRKKQSETPLNEIKVVFLGNGDVGKTHTIARLMRNDEKPDESFTGESTPGIAIAHKTYRIDGQGIQVHFWDFGGQDILFPMHRMFMTERTIYVVMVDARNESRGNQAREWLDTVNSFASKAAVMLVVNKLDQNPGATLDERGLREAYPNLEDIIFMSAKKLGKQAFHKAFTAKLLELIRRSEWPKKTWPKNWKRVKDALRDMKPPYIRSQQYAEICRDCSAEEDGGTVLQWCNDLGVCFCRQDDELQDYVILNPNWITNAIYTIIFNKQDTVRNGLISQKEIFRILKSGTSRKVHRDIVYSWGDMTYILDVVRKFDLSYPVDRENEFFPMLCSENSTAVVQEYAAKADTLEFHMKFDFLPNNVLHRLMVDCHRELDFSNVWLTGARFRQMDTGLSAVVKIEEKEKLLKLYVRSDDPSHAANTYLSVMAGTVERICRSLNLEIGKRWVIYKEDDKRVEFDYDDLLFELEMGDTYKTCKELRKRVPIADILKQSGHSADTAKQEFIQNLTDACRKLQSNQMYWNVGEDARTTGLRDALSNRYITMDQHLSGAGATGKRPGEMDLDIRLESNTPWTAIEAMNISGAQFANWDSHLDKLLTSYNHEGRSFLFHVSYVSADMDKFGDIITKFWDHVQKYHPPKMPVRFSNWMSLARERHDEPRFVKAMECVYDCGGIPMTVYHFFVRMGR